MESTHYLNGLAVAKRAFQSLGALVAIPLMPTLEAIYYFSAGRGIQMAVARAERSHLGLSGSLLILLVGSECSKA